MKIEDALPLGEGETPDPQKHYVVLSNGLPGIVKGEDLSEVVAGGAKPASQEEYQAIRETTLQNRFTGEHPLAAWTAGPAAKAVEQVLPIGGGLLVRGGLEAAEALGGPTVGESQEAIERSAKAHPWLTTIAEIGGFVGGMGLVKGGVKLAGKGLEAGGLLAKGATAEKAAHVGASTVGSKLAHLAQATGKEAALTSVQQAGAAFNEELIGDPEINAERLLGATARGAKEGFALGAAGEIGGEIIAALGKPVLRGMSRGLNVANEAFNKFVKGERGLSLEGRAFMMKMGDLFGPGARTGKLGKLIGDGSINELAEIGSGFKMPIVSSLEKRIIASQKFATALEDSALDLAKATPGLEAVRAAQVLRVGGMGEGEIAKILRTAGGEKRAVAMAEELTPYLTHGETIPNLARRVKAGKKTAGEEIGAVTKELDDAVAEGALSGEALPDMDRAAERIRSEVIGKLGGEGKGLVPNLMLSEVETLSKRILQPLEDALEKRSRVATLAGASGSRSVTFSEARAFKTYLDDAVRTWAKEPPFTDVTRMAAGIVREELGAAIERAAIETGSDVATRFAAANRTFGALSEVSASLGRKGLGRKAAIDLEKTPAELLSRMANHVGESAPDVAKRLRQASTARQIADLAETAEKRGEAKFAAKPIQAIVKGIGVGPRALLGGALAGSVLDPEDAAKLRELVREHQGAAWAIGGAALLAAQYAPPVAARVLANFVRMGQRDAVKAIGKVSETSAKKHGAILQHFFEDAVRARKIVGTAVHHEVATAAQAAGYVGEQGHGEQLARVAHEIKANPKRAVEATALAAGVFHGFAPNHASALSAARERDQAYLATLAPSPKRAFSPLSPHQKPEYSRVDLMKIEDADRAMHDTSAVIDEMFSKKTGLISSATIDALHATRPKIMAQLATQTAERLADMRAQGRVPDHASRLRLSRIFNVPFDPSMQPEARVAAQETASLLAQGELMAAQATPPRPTMSRSRAVQARELPGLRNEP